MSSPTQPFFKASLQVLGHHLQASRCESTFKRYDSFWVRFKSWCSRAQVRSLPASPLHFAMFLACTSSYAQSQNLSFTPVKMASAAISTAHSLAGLPDVTNHPVANSVRSSARRFLLSGQVNQKDPLPLGLCMTAVHLLLQWDSLSALRSATYIMVSFAGFLRFDDARSLFCDEIRFYPTHMELFLEKRKNNQFRHGETICIARGSSFACPVRLTFQLISSTNSHHSHSPLFPWSYSFTRRTVLQALADAAQVPLSEFSKSFGLHSFRSGGATLVAGRGVPDHVFQAHGAWRSSQSMQRYVSRSLSQQLLPTQAMQY